MNDLYFNWLVERVSNGMDETTKKGKKILNLLWDNPFRYLHRMDSNRIDDAESLRLEFGNIYNSYIFSKPHCVLEVLVALADRMAYNIMAIDEVIPNTAYCFWEMMDNLNFSTNDSNNQHILDRFLDKEYDRNGYGGIFPLKSNRKNQRRLDLWYQMQNYINENLY